MTQFYFTVSTSGGPSEEHSLPAFGGIGHHDVLEEVNHLYFHNLNNFSNYIYHVRTRRKEQTGTGASMGQSAMIGGV